MCFDTRQFIFLSGLIITLYYALSDRYVKTVIKESGYAYRASYYYINYCLNKADITYLDKSSDVPSSAPVRQWI